MKCDSRLEHSTPSQLEGGRRVVGNRLLNFSSSIATARGTVIHALFEQIKWLEDGVPDRSKSLQIARRLSDSNLDPARLVDDFEKMLSMPTIDAILRRDFYRPADGSGLSAFRATDLMTKHLKAQVFTERRFVVQDTGTQDQSRLLSGTIDRLVLLYNGESVVAADILDYKTDSLADESQTADSVAADSVAATDKLVAHYRPQLEAYRRAIGSMYGLPLELVSARLLFVARGIVRTI